MLRRLLGPLPPWARSNHPLLRYELNRTQRNGGRAVQTMRILSWALLLALLLLIGIVIATEGLSQPAGVNAPEALWRIVFFPALALQLILRAVALSLGIGVVSEERRRQTWDHMRVTSYGADLTLRTRWVAVFYRLQIPLYTVIVIRILLAVGLLYQLTSHRGGYLDVLTANIIPVLPLIVGVAVLAATMSAAFLLPITAVGVDVALGLLISTVIRSRTVAGLLQVLIIAFHTVLALLLLYGMALFLQGEWTPPGAAPWLLTAAYSIFADWGLLLMQLGEAGEIWAIIPFGVFIGLVMLGWALLQAVAIDLLLAYSARRAEKHE